MKFKCEGNIFDAEDYESAKEKVLDWNGLVIEEVK